MLSSYQVLYAYKYVQKLYIEGPWEPKLENLCLRLSFFGCIYCVLPLWGRLPILPKSSLFITKLQQKSLYGHGLVALNATNCYKFHTSTHTFSMQMSRLNHWDLQALKTRVCKYLQMSSIKPLCGLAQSGHSHLTSSESPNSY